MYSDYVLGREQARNMLSTLQRKVLQRRLPAAVYNGVFRWLTLGDNDDMEQRQAARDLAQMLPRGMRPPTRQDEGYAQGPEILGGGYMLERYVSDLTQIVSQY